MTSFESKSSSTLTISTFQPEPPSEPSPAHTKPTIQASQMGSPPTTSEPLPCPRCNSQDTKFCYYNNYNLSQPRYFCKSCRRYWTRGGALRDVPVGGGSRKTAKRSRTASPATSTTGSPSTGSVSAPSFPSIPVYSAAVGSAETCGKFTSLLAVGGLDWLGPGLGLDEVRYDLGSPRWVLSGNGYVGGSYGGGGNVCGVGGGTTWRMESDDGCHGGSGGGGGDCYSSLPELAMSMSTLSGGLK